MNPLMPIEMSKFKTKSPEKIKRLMKPKFPASITYNKASEEPQ